MAVGYGKFATVNVMISQITVHICYRWDRSNGYTYCIKWINLTSVQSLVLPEMLKIFGQGQDGYSILES